MSTRARTKLESLSNLAVIIAAIVFVVALVHHEWPSPQPGTSAWLQGKTIDLAPLAGSPANDDLVMFISEACPFCRQEMPFYRTLRRRLPKNVSLIAVFPAHQAAPKKFLAAHSVAVDRVVLSDSLVQIGVTKTPTLLLVNGRGKVLQAWVGAQPSAQHKKILSTIERDADGA